MIDEEDEEAFTSSAVTNMEFMFLKTWLHDRPCHGAHLHEAMYSFTCTLHVGMHSHASQRTRSCFDVVRQVASIKEKRRKRKKKKIMNSGRMGSLANNGQQPHVKEFLR